MPHNGGASKWAPQPDPAHHRSETWSYPEPTAYAGRREAGYRAAAMISIPDTRAWLRRRAGRARLAVQLGRIWNRGISREQRDGLRARKSCDCRHARELLPDESRGLVSITNGF